MKTIQVTHFLHVRAGAALLTSLGRVQAGIDFFGTPPLQGMMFNRCGKEVDVPCM